LEINQRIIVLSHCMYTRPFCISSLNLANDLTNKIWLICHQKDSTKTSCLCESNDIIFVTYNSYLVGKFNDQNLYLKYKVALYIEMEEEYGEILLNLSWNTSP
jgi:hypothetical protein